jgi:hypothetical protein
MTSYNKIQIILNHFDKNIIYQSYRHCSYVLYFQFFRQQINLIVQIQFFLDIRSEVKRSDPMSPTTIFLQLSKLYFCLSYKCSFLHKLTQWMPPNLTKAAPEAIKLFAL